MLHIILLVILFCEPEGVSRFNANLHFLAGLFFIFRNGFFDFGDFRFLFIKDARSILAGRDAANQSRCEIFFYDLFVRNFGQIKSNFDRFRMTGSSRADLLVCGILRQASSVTNYGASYAVELA